jgi:hypothetical protein
MALDSTHTGQRKRSREFDFDIPLLVSGKDRSKKPRGDDIIVKYGIESYMIEDIDVNLLMTYETQIKFMKKFHHLFEEIYTKEKMRSYDQIITNLEYKLVTREKYYHVSSPEDENIFIDFFVRKLWTKQKKSDTRDLNHEDIVLCEYTPFTQKYIDEYNKCSFFGQIFYVDEKNDNYFMFRVNHDNILEIRSYIVEGCHYCGLGSGYAGSITKMS